MTKAIELKPCPFCGSKAEVTKCGIHCTNAGNVENCCNVFLVYPARATARTQKEIEVDIRERSIKAWNKRAELEKQAKQTEFTKEFRECLAENKEFFTEDEIPEDVYKLRLSFIITNAEEACVQLDQQAEEFKQLKTDRDRLADDFNYAHEKKKELQAEVERLKEVIENYGRHRKDCMLMRMSARMCKPYCTCGFEQALKEGE